MSECGLKGNMVFVYCSLFDCYDFFLASPRLRNYVTLVVHRGTFSGSWLMDGEGMNKRVPTSKYT